MIEFTLLLLYIEVFIYFSKVTKGLFNIEEYEFNMPLIFFKKMLFVVDFFCVPICACVVPTHDIVSEISQTKKNMIYSLDYELV